LLNETTRKGLKSLTNIGNTAIIRYPWTTVVQADRNLIAFVGLEEYGETPFSEFGLESLSEFLALVEFYRDPEITVDDTTLTLTSGNRVQRYTASDVDDMKAFDIPTTMMTNVGNTPDAITFEISASELQNEKKNASLTRASSFIVNGKDSTITVCKLDRNKNISDDSVTQYAMASKEDTSIVFDMNNISKLPDKDYTVYIKKSESTGNYISLWEVSDEPIKIIVSLADFY